ncbi:HNH endonuclease signature motif containing protein [Patescibacteria group bacterium]
MPQKLCKICSQEFYAKPSHIIRGWGLYCSKKCQYIGQHNGKYKNCTTCDKEIYRTEKELRVSKSKNYFCNKSCFAVWKNQNLLCGEKHRNWKGGENAYRAIMIRGKIEPICKVCKYKDIRSLVVHHVDKNRKNNSTQNLIWLCRNCHHLVHIHGLKF